jgi:uncharacterized phage protein (TIGR01671 family)
MRTIKFRAWDKKNNCWADLNELSDWGSASFTAVIGMGNEQYPYRTFKIENDNQYEIQQFTGLLDKKGNGKEVYGSDLLRDLPNGKEPRVIWEVFFDDAYLDWRVKSIDGEMSLAQYARGSNFEVIGNIYENPELLTPKQ